MSFDSHSLVEAVLRVEREECIEPFRFETESQNQLLFFFKPEVFLGESSAVESIVDTAIQQMDLFGLSVAGCLVMTGDYLADNRIMDRHYGYINTISRDASSAIPTQVRAEILEALKVADTTPVLGGHEFLERYDKVTPVKLDTFWASKESVKIRSGLYVQAYEYGGNPIVLVNGFHPAQLEHFTRPDRRIAVVLLNSDLPWSLLRLRFLGDTFPERSLRGSFRWSMYHRAHEFGFSEVSIANNCAHMSAGPFEALFEIRNFLAESQTTNLDFGQCALANRMRAKGFSFKEVNHALTNPSR